ncbi:MAG: ribbon-helix-helix protein, CopG family [Phycisphaerales bacterium]
MPTSVHLPKSLLDAVDRRARSLRLSRNKLIVRALERELRDGHDWSPGFFDRLGESDPQVSSAVDEMLAQIHRARRPPCLSRRASRR